MRRLRLEIDLPLLRVVSRLFKPSNQLPKKQQSGELLTCFEFKGDSPISTRNPEVPMFSLCYLLSVHKLTALKSHLKQMFHWTFSVWLKAIFLE
jgi:hypothetical protein